MTRVKTGLAFLLTFLLVVSPATSFGQDGAREQPTRQDVREIVEILAHPAFGGRGTDQPGSDAAALFLARELRTAGFLPLPNNPEGYFHSFTFLQDLAGKTNEFYARWIDEELSAEVSGSFRFEDDFLPMLLGTKTGTVEGQLAFVGYGITAAEHSYDDYAGIDVSKKIVVILRHEPRETSDDTGVFAGKELTEYAYFTSKVQNALKHGAAGVVFVQDILNHEGVVAPIDLRAKSTRREFAIGTRFPFLEETEDAPVLPVISVSVAVADELLGNSVKNLQESVDKNLRPNSFVTEIEVRITTSSAAREHRSRNVVGYIPGTTENEYVIVGAHYDHLGVLSDGTYFGADDNASGTAAILALAGVIGERVRNGWRPQRSIVIGFWGAEEWGLQGSWRFAHSDLVPRDRRIAMVNLDMVGRNDPNYLFVLCAEQNSTCPEANKELFGLLQTINSNLENPFELDLSHEGFFRRTDSASFFSASPNDNRLPVLTMSTFIHDDYHAPTDTADKIDFDKLRRVASLAYQLVLRLVDSDIRPIYRTPEEQK